MFLSLCSFSILPISFFFRLRLTTAQCECPCFSVAQGRSGRSNSSCIFDGPETYSTFLSVLNFFCDCVVVFARLFITKVLCRFFCDCVCVYLFYFFGFSYSFRKVSVSSLIKALLRDCSTWPSADNRNQNVRFKNGSVVWLVSLAAARLNAYCLFCLTCF